MQVSLSDTGGLSRRLEVAVPATEVAREVQQRLKRLSRTARLKGFRPGKAPLTVIAKQFGDQVRAEVLSDLVRSSFAQAVSEQKLRPAGGPRIEPIAMGPETDRKSTRLNSSHRCISYAVFCLKKKKSLAACEKQPMQND